MIKPLQARPSTAMQYFRSCDLVTVFNLCFEQEFNTVLVGGAREPVYLPADTTHPRARVVFTHNYFASALHEAAHWCVAGQQRRLQQDYGYWYAPDGRSAEQQASFETVEAQPQALEWIFSVAAGAPFRVSADNVAAGLGPSEAFLNAISQQARQSGSDLKGRAKTFAMALAKFYKTGDRWQREPYLVNGLHV